MQNSFFLMAEQFSKALTPSSVVDGLRMGRITALQKPNGGVRGIVAGDAIRWSVSRTIAQQLGPAVERATGPYQYAMSTKESAWLLLLHCASPRANYLLRVLPPDQVLRYAQVHDDRLWHCFCALLGIPLVSAIALRPTVPRCR